MISRFAVSALQGETIRLRPPYDDRVDLIHARDVADALLDAFESGARGVFNIASGIPVSIREIAETLVAITYKGVVAMEPSTGETAGLPVTRFSLNCDAARQA